MVPVPTTNEPRINERIRAREVRLVGPEGAQLGIKPLPEALHAARELDLDLVEVAPQASPPVCRIMDYGRFKFEAAQRAKESRRKTTNVAVKEMKYRPKIGTADFETKTRQVSRFLAEGHKVKITIMFRGREVYHQELGKAILDRIAEQMDGNAKIEAVPRLDGRNMTMVLAPDRRAHQSGASRGDHKHTQGRAPAKEAGAAGKRVSADQAVPANGSTPPVEAQQPAAQAPAPPEPVARGPAAHDEEPQSAEEPVVVEDAATEEGANDAEDED